MSYGAYSGGRAYKTAFAFIGRGFRALGRQTRNDLDVSAHRHPWPWIVITAIVVWCIGFGMFMQSRTNEEVLSYKNFLLSQQADSLQLRIEGLEYKVRVFVDESN